MRKTVILIGIAILAGLAAAAARSQAQVTFQDLVEGKKALKENCIDCHSLEWPLKKVATRAEWELILTKMANTGAVLGREQRQQLLEYLVAKSSFQVKCSVCHGLERSLEKNKEFQDWILTVRRMADKDPGTLTEDEIRAISGFLTAKGAATKLF